MYHHSIQHLVVMYLHEHYSIEKLHFLSVIFGKIIWRHHPILFLLPWQQSMEEMHKVSSTKKFLTLIGHEHNIKTPKWEFLYLQEAKKLSSSFLFCSFNCRYNRLICRSNELKSWIVLSNSFNMDKITCLNEKRNINLNSLNKIFWKNFY